MVCAVALMVLAIEVAAFAQPQITIADARQQGVGATVMVEGTVTRALGAFVRFQDDSGPTGATGLVIRQTSGAFADDVANGTITRGTILQVEGTLSEFNGLLQINEDDLASYTVQSQGSLPAAQSVTLEDLRSSGEDYESELITVSGLRLLNGTISFSADATYDVVQGERATPFDLRIQGSDESELGGTAAPPATFTYTGILGQFDRDTPATTGYQLIPVRTTDLSSPPFFTFARAYGVAQEADGTVQVSVVASNLEDGETISVSVSASSSGTADPSTDLAGSISPSALSFTGPDPAPQSVSLPLADDGTTEGVEYLTVTLSSTDAETAGTFTQWILDDATSQGAVAAGLEGSRLLDELIATYGGASTLVYDNPGTARDTMFASVYEAQGDSLRGVYTDFARFIPEDADPTVAACNFDTGGCTDNNDINTEHSWPQSLGAGEMPAQGDMHILFPARGDVNGARLNYPFGEIDDADAEEWYLFDRTRSDPPENSGQWSKVDLDGERFEPRDAVKGDIARALFYFITMYPEDADLSFFREQRDVLRQWHASDPVDAAETRRNVLQASYQDNKLNPYVVDPTLVERAFGAIAAPTNLISAPGNMAISLRWTEPLSGTPAGYNVYRSTSAFDAPGEAQLLTPEPATSTSFNDDAPVIGVSYTYRVTTVDPDGAESNLSSPVTARVYPSTIAVDIEQAFQDISSETSYRLVGLPGNVDRPLGDALGEPEVDWTAFWDDGSDSDFLVRFDGSDTFRFAPGRGFWLLSSENWVVDDVVASVPLSSGTVTVPLHDGWNIISNPFPVDVLWTDVDDANVGTTLQPVWAWDGAFQEADTFASAANGEAFYFFNDSGLSELMVPLAPASVASSTPAQASLSRAVTLEARFAAAKSQTGARVRVGESPDASDQRDALDHVAPRARFAPVSMYVSVDGRDAASRLARDVRASSAEGQTYDLKLTAPAGEPVTIAPVSLPSDASVQAVLIQPDTGTRYNLRRGAATITPAAESTSWTLLVGTDAYVRGMAPERVTEISVAPPSPNPFRSQTTLRYVLPEAETVSVRVYDLLGRRIQTLIDQQQPSGAHQLQWDGTSGAGSPVASGMYFMRVRIGDTEAVHKVVHVR